MWEEHWILDLQEFHDIFPQMIMLLPTAKQNLQVLLALQKKQS